MKKSVMFGGLIMLAIPLVMFTGCEKTNLQIVNSSTNKSISKIEKCLNDMYVPLQSDFCIDVLSTNESIKEVSFSTAVEPNTESLWDFITNHKSFFSITEMSAKNPFVKFKVNYSNAPQSSQTDSANSALSTYFTKVTNLSSQMNSSFSLNDSLEQAKDCVTIKKELLRSKMQKINKTKTSISNETCNNIKAVQSEISKCCDCVNSSNSELKNEVSAFKSLKTNLTANIDKLTEKFTKINSNLDSKTSCLNDLCNKLDEATETLANGNKNEISPNLVSSDPHYLSNEILLKPIISRDEYIKKFEDAEAKKSRNNVSFNYAQKSAPDRPIKPRRLPTQAENSSKKGQNFDNQALVNEEIKSNSNSDKKPLNDVEIKKKTPKFVESSQDNKVTEYIPFNKLNKQNNSIN